MKKNAGSSASWDTMSWNVPIGNSSTVIRINVRSHRKLIGFVDVTAQDLISIRKNKVDITEMVRSLSVGGASTGTVTIVMKLNDSRTSYYKQHAAAVSQPLSGATSLEQALTLSPSAKIKDLPPVAAKDARLLLDANNRTIGVLSVDMNELNNPDKMATKRKPTAGNGATTIAHTDNAGKSPLRAHLIGRIIDPEATAGAGVGKKPSNKTAPLGPTGPIGLKDDGAFKINVVDMIQRLESTTAALAIAEANKAREAEKAANKALVAISALPVVLKIHSIALIDLRKVHRFASNSPYISCVCGPWANVTAPIPNAGSAAVFDGLSEDVGNDSKHPAANAEGEKNPDEPNEEEDHESSWTLVLNEDESSSLGIVVSSQKEVIGTVAITAQELVRTERTASGIMKVIKDLSSLPKFPFAGKIKLVFSFEKYKHKKHKKDKEIVTAELIKETDEKEKEGADKEAGPADGEGGSEDPASGMLMKSNSARLRAKYGLENLMGIGRDDDLDEYDEEEDEDEGDNDG
jgi:hypothetical protein